ncbi:MAG: hypothetical protein Fur0037_11420 [Planctomycetota bacterium]
MSARSSVQTQRGTGEGAAAPAAAVALEPERREPKVRAERRPDPENHFSPDPLRATDRYRLAMPFQDRL